tara:strand:+ start:4236 stop:6527 length:2292 start_codon:yes stop_codon:yes gene_type:complete
MSIEESLLGNSQFLGRDGFRWWIGQIPPRKAQADQTDDGKGWAYRYKVRIMGYHPFTDDVLDEDLPWAICLLPTTAGSGAANYTTSTCLQQGDVVFGFFMDGDEGQVPVIVAHFPHATGVEQDEEFEGKFKTGSAFTDNTPVNPKTELNDNGVPDQTGEQNEKSNPTNSSATKGKNVDQSGAGTPVVAPDTCTTNSVSRMAQAVENLAQRVEDLQLTGMKLEAEIDAVADQVESMANGFVGRMMDSTYDFLEPQLQKGLDKVYGDTFGKVFAQMGNSPQSYASAHAAGVASQIAQVPAIKNMENSLSCVGNKVVEGLRGTVSDMLKDLLASGLGMAGCVSANFVGKFVGNMINGIGDNLKSPLSGLSDLLDVDIDIAGFLRSSAFVLEDFSGFLDCGQTNKDKCPPVKKYQVAGGPMEKGADPFNYITSQMKKTSKGGGLGSILGDATGGGLLGAATGLLSGGGLSGLASGLFDNLIPPGVSKTLGTANRISGLLDELSGGGSCGGGNKNCGNPTMQIFGGGGFGAIGKVVMGKVIDNSGLGGIADGISKTASIIGVDLKVPGANYKSPPAISFSDKCGKGYGAHGHAVLNTDGTIGAVVIDTVGEGYPVITDPPTNVGLTTVFVEDPGSGYKPGDAIDESVFITTFPTGFPDPDTGVGAADVVGVSDDPTIVADPYTQLVPTGQRVALTNVTNKPVFDIVVNPETGGIEAVKVLNILKYDTPPLIKVLSDTGQGAVLRPVFGEIPESVQQDVITVIDCVGVG